MGSTRGLYNGIPSPPEVMSKSMNISQSETKLTDSGSQAASGPTLQGKPSYVSTVRNGLPFPPPLAPPFHPGHYDVPYSRELPYQLMAVAASSPVVRLGPPLEYGPPPPGLRSGLSKKKKEDARRESYLKDSANPYCNPTSRYAPEVMQYPKAPPEGSIQRTRTSFRNHEHDFSSPRYPDTGDSRGEPLLNLEPELPLYERGTPITPSALLPTQNQSKDVIGVRSVNNGNSTVLSTNPLPLHLSLPGDSQALATSSNTCKSIYRFSSPLD